MKSLQSSYIFFIFFWQCSALEIERPNLFEFLFLGASPTSLGVVTSDFSGGGRFKTFEPNSLTTFPTSTPIHSDAVGRFADDKVYIINRLNRDSIQVLNPNLGFFTEQEFSVGQGNNPQDIIPWKDKYFVSLYNGLEVPIFSRVLGQKIGAISLEFLRETFSSSGIPDGSIESSYMIPVGASLFLLVQRLDRNDASGFLPPNSVSYLVEIDMDGNFVRNVYPLPFRNPSSKIQRLTIFGEDSLVFSCVGRVGFLSQLDAGILAFRLRDRQFFSNLLLSESVAGGDILAFRIADDDLGYASTLDASFNKKILAFRPRTGEVLKTLLSIPGTFGISLSGLHLTPDGKLVVGSTDFGNPGLLVFDTRLGDLPLTPLPVSVELTPFDIFQLQNPP